ncbi:MAG: HEAT repeat domain-containing protein [Planctomycetota bacterium]
MPPESRSRRAQAIDLERSLARASGREANDIAAALLDLVRTLEADAGSGRSTDLMTHLQRVWRRPRLRLAARLRMSAARAAPRLSEAARHRVAESFGSGLVPAVRSMLTDDHEATRSAGLTLAVTRSLLGVLPAAAGLVEAEPNRLGDQAARCLAELAGAASAWETAAADERERAASAICEAADAYPGHRRLDAVRAALLLQSPRTRAGGSGQRAARWLHDTDEAVRLAARTAMRDLPGAPGARRAFELLPEPMLTRAAAERLANAERTEEIDALLGCAHLLARPSRRSALRARVTAPAAAGLLPDPAGSQQRGLAARRGLPRWLDALPIQIGGESDAETDGHQNAMEPLLADPDDAARLAGAAAARGSILADFVLDSSPCIAQTALTRLRFEPGARGAPALSQHVLGLTERSQHPSVRCFGPKWLGRPTRPAIDAARRLQHRPAETVAAIAAAIESGDIESAAIAAKLGIADHLLPALAQAMRSDDSRLVATACRALGTARSAEARPLLVRALDAGDPRVRSNTIEALGRSCSRGGAAFDAKPQVDDRHHRVRATALRESVRLGNAPDDVADRIQSLLTGDALDQRLAGLWLTERAATELKPLTGRGWSDLAARVAGLARASGERERRRATRAARRMLAVSIDQA